MSNVQLVLTEGQQILDSNYDGVPYGWRDGGESLRTIAKSYDISLSTLYRCVATTSMWLECGGPPLQHLGMSHLRELLSLEIESQQALMYQAESERWTVKQIAAARKQHTRRTDVRPGRTANSTSAIAKSLLATLTDASDRIQLVGRTSPLAESERQDLLQTVGKIRQALEQMSPALSATP